MACPDCLGQPYAPGEDGGVGVCATCNGTGHALCECEEVAEMDGLCGARAEEETK